MSKATLTLIGLKNFLDYYETDLFENLTLPEGIDKESCINNILLTCGDNELLYPDGDFMINCIGLWSTKWYRTFEKWINALDIEYAPLENYDRHEDWSDSASTSESSSVSASDSSSNSTSNENDVSAFNDSSFNNDTASTLNGIAASSSQSNAINQGQEYSIHGGRIHGNIGVTTSQQMLQAELDIARFNLLNEIAIIFAREFTLGL